jgi:hypothetical protein
MNKKAVVLILLFIFSGVSCTHESQITQSLPLASTSPTSEGSPPVPLTATLLPGLSPPPSPEYPLRVTPRVTPLPTRSPTEVTEQLNYLLQTNGDCLLPCFWGIYPDQTRYEELYGVIDQLQGRNFFDIVEENGHLRVSSNFTYEKKVRFVWLLQQICKVILLKI